jgi:hypothetical protein
LKLKLLILGLLAFSLVSCREEIIAPGNPAGNINQPVKEVFPNSYTFLINAGDISFTVLDNLNFENGRTQIYLSVTDHSSGSAVISLMNKSQRIIFTKTTDSELSGEYIKIDSEAPGAVRIRFLDFSGKFKLTISRY